MVGHWNCLSLTDVRKSEFGEYLRLKSPDIVSLNEVKLDEHKANASLNFPGYVSVFKVRKNNPNNGGGVALLIRDTINFVRLSEFDIFDCELIGIDVFLPRKTFSLFTLYNPPDKKLSLDLFQAIEAKDKDWMVIGDLNSKLVSIGCNADNNNGKVLDEVLWSCRAHLINNKEPTFHRVRDNYTEILDLCVCSTGISLLIDSFEVEYKWDMDSDHYPICVSLDLAPNNRARSEKDNRYNLSRANWALFGSLLNCNPDEEILADVNKLNLFIVVEMLRAAERSIPKLSNRPFGKTLPKEIRELIKERNKARKKSTKSKRTTDVALQLSCKKHYNYLSRRVKAAIGEHKNKLWTQFLEKAGKNPVSSRPFWQRVNALRSNKSASRIPCLLQGVTDIEGKKKTAVIEKDEEKAEIFRRLLSDRFAGANDMRFNSQHKVQIEESVRAYVRDTDEARREFEPVSMNELLENVKRLKTRSAPGKDGVCNVMLKNLPPDFLELIRKLCNLTLKEGKIPNAWKESQITMIPKGSKVASDPNNYRPISLLSCLGKLVERIVAQRLVAFLEKKKIIIKQQSGFRTGRRTTDNLAFLTQKISESILRKSRKVVALSFDIQAAFDTVWHMGLISKLISCQVPAYIILWVFAFLGNRSFVVKVNNFISSKSPILAGVPQGSSLSPILFSVFINDIPTRYVNNVAHSLLFADDLLTFFTFRKTGNVANLIKNYLKEIETWLSLWRLKMAPSKCSYTIFFGK